MSEYFDIRCGDDVDLFGRDAPPLETAAQDIYHLLITEPMTLLRDPDWGFGLERYLGKQLPPTLAKEIETAVTKDDRFSDAKCTIVRDPNNADNYRLTLTVAVDGNFLTLALVITPDGIVRVS